MARDIRPSLRTKVNLKAQLIARLRFSHVLTLSEKEFAKMISEIESDPLFQKLIYPKDSGLKAVFKRRVPHQRMSQSFFDVKEEISAGSEGVDVEKILAQHKGVVDLIRRIGQDLFEKHFLYKEGAESIESIAQTCGISAADVVQVQNAVTQLSVHSEFFNPSTLPAEGGLRYAMVARIDPDEHGSFWISFTAPHLAAGRYVINPERVEALKKFLDASEKKSVTNLLQKLELINLRQDTLQKMLQEILTRQSAYLQSNDPKRRMPLTQREMATYLGVAPSTICRSLYGKSVVAPWGQELPLKDFFVNKKTAAEEWVRQILDEMSDEKKDQLSDNDLREILIRRFHLRASRRSVNLYRRAAEKK